MLLLLPDTAVLNHDGDSNNQRIYLVHTPLHHERGPPEISLWGVNAK
jgi:hypothetical protein